MAYGKYQRAPKPTRVVKHALKGERSRTDVRNAGFAGLFTQQYRTMVRRELRDPATPEVRRIELLQQISDYAQLGGNVSDMLR